MSQSNQVQASSSSERAAPNVSSGTSTEAKMDAPAKKQKSFNAGRFDNDPERARIAGRKGGANPNNSGRFDNNPARAREAGQKGGQSSQAARQAAASSTNTSTTNH